ncbi:MAG: glycoside hydrolase family 15 protein [Actinobacteria bacterium]|nr:glycoside hydrolase family 15 protein [Actinomycetota bacterium]
MNERSYQPLDDYGLIGDLHGAALVSRDGSIDWACFPRFDSPSLFARLLDSSAGGHWQLAPEGSRTHSTMRYLEHTAVLETVHETGTGSVRVLDAALPPVDGRSPSVLVRVCEGLAGRVELESVLRPAFDYARDRPRLEPLGDVGLRIAGAETSLSLVSSIGQQGASARVVLEPDERSAFVLGWDDEMPRPGDAQALLDDASAWWRAWCETCAYEGPYLDAVLRSAITLRLLTHLPTGAIVAAPTTSLPEIIGGESNWDYRYTWLRDAALTLYAWYATGQRAEGDPFFDWICTRVGRPEVEESGLNVMYDVDGGSDHAEQVLDHLEGYRASSPVRIGNAACHQIQQDIYGEVLDCFASACSWGRADKLALWPHYRVLADWVTVNWREPGNGIWELRGEGSHYVYSKVMLWVALDRALRVAREKGLPGDLGRWASAAAEIRASVFEHGWSDRLGAFRQSFEVDELDASNLLIPLVGFLPSDDPRVRSNLDRTIADLGIDGLVYRFAPDGGAAEGAFTVCTFWLVNALAHAGRLDVAVDVFERMLGRSSPLGLFPEQISPGTGELLGNFPQCFTHSALLTSAVNLARAAHLGTAPASLDAPEGSAHLVPVRPDVAA